MGHVLLRVCDFSKNQLCIWSTFTIVDVVTYGNKVVTNL